MRIVDGRLDDDKTRSKQPVITEPHKDRPSDGSRMVGGACRSEDHNASPRKKNCPHHKIVALLSVEREWRLWVFLGIFPIFVSRYAGTSGCICWRFFLVVIRRCLRISLHYQPMQLIGKHVRTHWRVKGTVPVEGCKWRLRKRQVFTNYWGGGDDFRNYKQKRRYKKRVFVHKIKKAERNFQGKCILIFQG